MLRERAWRMPRKPSIGARRQAAAAPALALRVASASADIALASRLRGCGGAVAARLRVLRCLFCGEPVRGSRVNGGVASHGLAVLVFGVGECTTKCAASLRAGTTTAGGSPTLWLRGRSGCGVCVRHDTAFTGAWFCDALHSSVIAGGDVCDELSSDCSRPVRVLA